MNPDAPPQKGQALGSGFIISADGTIVTNNHVIENATKITVTLDDGKEFPARLIGSDAKNDIAVLKIEADGKLPTVAWGNSDVLRAGDPRPGTPSTSGTSRPQAWFSAACRARRLQPDVLDAAAARRARAVLADHLRTRSAADRSSDLPSGRSA